MLGGRGLDGKQTDEMIRLRAGFEDGDLLHLYEMESLIYNRVSCYLKLKLTYQKSTLKYKIDCLT